MATAFSANASSASSADVWFRRKGYARIASASNAQIWITRGMPASTQASNTTRSASVCIDESCASLA